MSLLLLLEWAEVEIVLFTALLLMIVAKVLTVEQAFAGFSNQGMLSIGLLFIVAGALHTTGALNQVTHLIFGRDRGNVTRKLLRILFPVSFISAFINNTPIVALLIPAIRSWTEKHNYAPSKFLIPLSYAAILGGICTLIGTSTILVVHGLLIQNHMPGLGFFEISRIGVPAALAGLLYIVFIGKKLLPDRKEPLVELGEKTREFVIALKVNGDYEHLGKTIEAAGLRHLRGLFLFQIERNGRIIAPADPNETLQLNDRLFFTGIPKTILELQKTPGLQLIRESEFDLKQYDSSQIRPYEAVISPSSPLIGRNVRESNFRGRYGAVIIAIHRSGERIQKKIGDIILHPGDTLLLLADRAFRKRWYHSNDFYLISGTYTIPSRPRPRMIVAAVVFLLMILLTVFNVLPLLGAAGLAVVALIVTRTITPGEAREAVNWRVLIVIAISLGIATGLKNSGVAAAIGEGLVRLSHPWGATGLVVALYLAASIYNNIITSNAAAAIIFPIALTAGISSGIDPRPLVIAIAIGAAASFSTPISYQTNLMVYGPGGYRFTDFVKVGVPLQIIVGVIALIAIHYFYF